MGAGDGGIGGSRAKCRQRAGNSFRGNEHHTDFSCSGIHCKELAIAYDCVLRALY